MFNVNLLLARRAWRYGQYGGLVVRRAVHMAQHQSASLLHASTRHSPPLHPHRKTGHMRSIFMWVENIFNRVDHARIRQVGPDRACAEFVLRMGGAIKLEPFKPAHHHENESDWIYKDNELPKHDRDNPLHVLAVDMRDSTLTQVGMEHFQNLEKLQRVDLSGSKYVNDDGLANLTKGCPSLRQIVLKDCPSVSDTFLSKLKAALPHTQIINK